MLDHLDGHCWLISLQNASSMLNGPPDGRAGCMSTATAASLQASHEPVLKVEAAGWRMTSRGIAAV